jgi:hypothetical protein
MKDLNIKVGEELFLRQEGRSSGYCYDVKDPYTVVSVSENEIVIQAAKCIFKEPAYFDSMPEKIVADPNGEKIVLHWSDKISGGCWWAYKDSTGRDYPLVAHFGHYEYYPYLD